MVMIGKCAAATLAVVVLGLAGPAFAQQTQTAPQAQPPAGQQQTMITIERAIEIARNHGLVNVREVERDDRGWEIEGSDAQGRKIEVEIDIRTGEVVDIERD